jgi:thiamine biosynthesis protein ThiS
MNNLNTQISIIVNGEALKIAQNLTVSDLIRQQQLTPERVAVEYNRTILTRSRWSETILKPEDQLEIVHFVGGG